MKKVAFLLNLILICNFVSASEKLNFEFDNIIESTSKVIYFAPIHRENNQNDQGQSLESLKVKFKADLATATEVCIRLGHTGISEKKPFKKESGQMAYWPQKLVLESLGPGHLDFISDSDEAYDSLIQRLSCKK